MSGPLNTENSVNATNENRPGFEEGEALEAMDPGMGVVRGDGGWELTGADTRTRRVVRERRNPGGLGIGDDESPLEKGYEAEQNVETLGFQPHDKARLRVEADDASNETISDGDELGWNADGYLSPNATEIIADARNEEDITIEDGDNEVVLIQFR